jgi:hypothetical protein
MRTGQDKILTDLATLVHSFGYEPVCRPNFANTGVIAVQHPDVVEEYAQIEYDFQPDTMMFRLTVQGTRVPSQPPRPDYFDFYMPVTNTAAYQAFRARVAEHLQALVTATPAT